MNSQLAETYFVRLAVNNGRRVSDFAAIWLAITAIFGL
jgi:hypothetical protein